MLRTLTFVLLSGAAIAGNATAADVDSHGKPVYLQVCRACHATGIAGAPQVGDRAAWMPRAERGIDALVQSAVRGSGGMPPKGGHPGLSEQQVRAAIQYMISQSQ